MCAPVKLFNNILFYFILFFCAKQDTVDSFVGTVIKQHKNGQYEVSFSDGRWILPALEIEKRANTQLGLTPNSVPPLPLNKGFTTLTGYKKWIYECLKSRAPTSIQTIFALVQVRKPKARRSLVLRAVRALENHGYIRKGKRHRRSYVSVVRKNQKKNKRKKAKQKKKTNKNHVTNGAANTQQTAAADQTSGVVPYTVTTLNGGVVGSPQCEVYVDQPTGVPYSCELTKINLDTNEDKFINMQLLKESGKNQCWFYWEWGKTGQHPNSKKEGPFLDVIGKAAFELKFKLKTGIDWGDRFTKAWADKYRFVNPLNPSSQKSFRWQYFMQANNQHNESAGWHYYPPGANAIVNMLCGQWCQNKHLSVRCVNSNQYSYKLVGSTIFLCFF